MTEHEMDCPHCFVRASFTEIAPLVLECPSCEELVELEEQNPVDSMLREALFQIAVIVPLWQDDMDEGTVREFEQEGIPLTPPTEKDALEILRKVSRILIRQDHAFYEVLSSQVSDYLKAIDELRSQRDQLTYLASKMFEHMSSEPEAAELVERTKVLISTFVRNKKDTN